MKKNINIRELERWLKSSLKNKVSIDNRSVIAYLMMGFAGLMMSTIANAGWTNPWGQINYWQKASGNADAFTFGWDAEKSVTGEGSVMITKGDKVNNKLQNSVVIGYGGGKPAGSDINPETQRLKIDVGEGGHGIVAIGSVRVSSNPHGVGATGNGGQAVAIGNDVTSTSQAVAIGNNTYALGNASIAIGSDDISSYRDRLTKYDYNTYLKALYDAMDPNHTSYGIGNGNANDIYSPNVAGGIGSISIGSRSMAYKDGTTALGTLAYALGKGATALGTQSRAEGEGSIAVGNKTRNFANQALAIGNDSQILNVGGTAVGLRARSGGEGSIAIGTDVYANVIMNTDPNIKSKLVDREMGTKSTTITDVENTVKDDKAINPELTKFHDIEGIIKTTANQKNAIVIGTRSVATGDNAMALGRGAFAMANNAFGIGSYSYADHVNAMAIGTSSRALAENSITVGAGSVATAAAKNATVLGTNSGVGGENSSVVGSDSEAFSKNTLIYGNETRIGALNSTNTTDNNIAIGNKVSIGSGVTNSMAYGPNTRIGDANRETNSKIDSSTAFGSGAVIERLYNGTTADKMTNAQAKSAADKDSNFMYTGNNAMAIGNNSRAVLENSVALGVRSDTDYTYSDLLQPGWTARGSIAVPTSGQTGVISVGSKGQERRIVNVASGYRDTDAVNVIQLRTLEETVTNKVDSIESGMHYLSVNKEGDDFNGEKGSKKVTQLIEREKNFNQYVRYRIQQIQLEARQKWQGEKFNEESLREIDKKVAELGADSEITRVASDLKNKTITTAVPTGKSPAEAYRDLVNELESIKYELVEKDRTDLAKIDGKYQKGKYNELLAGEDIAALKKATNYSNEGGQGDDSLAVGFRALAVKDESNAANKINAARAIAMGYKAKTSAKESISIGDESNVAVAADRGIAVGYKAQAEGARSLSLGSKSKAKGELSIAIGSNEHSKDGTTASGKQSIAFGNAAKATAEKAMAMGAEAEATAKNAVALGAAAKASIANSVALGQGTVAAASTGKSYLTDRAFSDTGKVVSVGNRRINQLEDGANDDDAVTVRQLKAAAPKLQAQNSNGLADNKLATNPGATIKVQADSWGSGDSRYDGSNLSTYIGGTADAPVVSIGLKENPKFKTLKLNNGATNAKDLSFTTDNDGNLNLATSNTANTKAKITNLADGTADSDAATVGQLKDATPTLVGQVTTAGNNTWPKIAPNARITITGGSFNTDNHDAEKFYSGDNLMTHISGTNAAPEIKIGIKKIPTFRSIKLNNENGGSQTLSLTADDSGNLNVGSKRITGVSNATGDNDAVNYSQLKAASPSLKAENAGTGITNNTLKTNNGSTIEFKSGDFSGADSVRYVGENLSTHIGGSADAPVVTVGLRKDPTFETLKLSNDKGNVTLSIDNSGNLNVGNKKITGVADGTISATSTDAINGKQLNTVKTTADTAKTTADTAKNTADTAKATADTAKNTADTAKTTADAAKNKADAAKTTADTAKNTADDVANKLTTLGDKTLTFSANSGTAVAKKLGESIGIEGDDTTISTKAGNNKITIEVKDGGISTAKLANKAVTTAKLADGAVGTTQLGNNAVTTAKLNDGAVTEAKLDDGLKTKINNANSVATNNIRLAGDPATAGGTATKTTEVSLNNTGGIEFAINGKDGLETKASGTKVEVGLSNTLKTKLAKLDNLDDNANNKYATKDETANKDLGNVTDTGKNVIKDAAREAVEVTQGANITVTKTEDTTNHKTTYNVALDKDTTDKINNIGKVADGKDGKDAKLGAAGTAGAAGAAGTHGLTGKDGLNGKDLTTKVNALRNGEAGTVVFTDKDGNRLVKANNGSYYKADEVGEDGNPKTTGGTTPTAVAEADIELRVVTSKGETKTTSIKLSNIADGKIAVGSKDAINGSQLNDVASKLGLTVGADGKTLTLPTITGLKDTKGTAGASPTSVVDGLNNVIGKVNEGIKYKGNIGNEETQQLGTVFNVVRAEKNAPLTETITTTTAGVTPATATTTINYVGDNLITKYTKDTATGNGKLEIGFKESPTFKDVTAESVTTKTLTFDDGKGKKLTVGPTTDGKALQIGNKEIATKEDVILKLTKDGTTDDGTVDLSKQKLKVVGSDGVDVSISGQEIGIKLDTATKNKLANLDTDANTKYATKTELDKKANKDADNLTAADVTAWKEKLGLSKAVSGTGSLSIEAKTKGTVTGATETDKGKATVKLDGTENFKMIGTDGVTVAATGKEITFGLDDTTKAAIKNIGKSVSDGKDGKDAIDGTNGANGTHGLTAKDGLNGKDLTTKVNALRNGEAGTVVYTDAQGNRLVKANDGKYYKPEFVSETGEVKPNTAGQTGVGIENPELRVVSVKGDTTTPNTLNNVASGLGLDKNKADGTAYGKPISETDAKAVVSGLLTKADGLNKAVTVGDLQALAQAGLDFEGNVGTTHKALGTTLKIIGKDITGFDNNKFTTDYSTDNVATNVKNDGTVEIGFKKSPTFTNVKADEVKITKDLIFDDGKGKPTTIVAGDGKGSLLINGKKVATSDSAPVLYTDKAGNVVEKGLDNKIYKVADLEGKRFDPNTKKYYDEDQFVDGVLKAGAVVATLQEVPANEVKHALAALDNNSVTGGKVLTNVADGKIDATSKDAINGSQIKNVLDKIGVTTDANGNVEAPIITKIKDDKGEDPTGTAPTTLKDGLNAVIDKVNKGIQYAGDSGTGTQQLGTVFNVNKAGSTITNGTGTSAVNYVGDNVITKYTKNTDGSGKLEIGFKESPTFKDVKADNITATGNITGKDGKFENLKVTEKIETREIVFKNGTGDDLTIANGKDGRLYINGVVVPTADSAPVIYSDKNGNRVELGQDGKVYKPSELTGQTYVPAKAAVGHPGDTGYTPAVTAGYYADNQFETETTADGTTKFKQDKNGNRILKANATVSSLTEYTDEVLHKLSPITGTGAKRLTNVADGELSSTSTDAVNGKQLNAVKETPIKFVGDDNQEVERKLGQTLKINGDGIKVSKNAAGDGLVLSIAKGKVETINVADKAITSAKLAEDARTVVYVTEANEVIELGADGKLHKATDLKGKTYVVSTEAGKTGFYNDTDLNAEGQPKAGATPVTVADVNPATTKLRHALNGYVAGGTDVTTKSVLTNVGAGKIDANSTDAINGSQLKAVADKVGLTVDTTNNLSLPAITALKDTKGNNTTAPTTLVGGLNDVISKVNEGLSYKGDLGTQGTQQLGSTVTINRTGRSTVTGETALKDGTETYTKYEVVKDTTTNQNKIVTTKNQTRDVTYVGDNLITKYTKDATGNGKFEIGFKENPTFKQITADHVDTKTITFNDGQGNKLTVGPSADGKSLVIGEKEIATKEDVILKLTKDGTNDHGTVDLSKDKLHVASGNNVTVDIANNKITVGLDATTKAKLDNLDVNANDKYANKDASNIVGKDLAAWKTALGINNVVSGTGNLSIDAATKDAAGTETPNGKATVKLDGTENFKLLGTDGITVKGATTGSNKTLTFGLDDTTKAAIKNIGKSVSDGRDGKDATNGTNGANGTNGLTAKDGLNGKDLTTKVNALRNGEAGTVVFTDKDGNRLVKANDGYYYTKDKVKEDGSLVNPADAIKKANDGKYYAADKVDTTGALTDPNATPVAYNPELRVVNEDGSTTEPNKLSNVADGKIAIGSKDAINGSQIKNVLDKIGVTTDADGNVVAPTITAIKGADGKDGAATTSVVDGLNKVITTVNSGISYAGDSGTGTQQLGSKFSVNRAGRTTVAGETALTETVGANTINYVGDNVITKYTKDTATGNGKLEIGFKESPTFKNVTAENIDAMSGKLKDLKVTDKITTKEIVFDSGTGTKLTLVTGKDGNLYINGVAVPTAENAPVTYTNTNGDRIELGQDGNLYKPADIKDLTYVPADATKGIQAGYYEDNQFEKLADGSFKQDEHGNKVLNGHQTPKDLTTKAYTGEVLHSLSPINKNNPSTTGYRLVHVADGKDNNDAVNMKQLNEVKETPITFIGDDNKGITRKLGETLKINGNGIKVTKNKAGDGLELSISKGKVDTVNVKDKAVTSAKLAEDARTVVYVTPDNKAVELGADGKLHKAEDLAGKTYVVVKNATGAVDNTKTGYYADADVNEDGELKNLATATKLPDPEVVDPTATKLRHALNGYVAGGTNVMTKSVLTNVGEGTVSATSTDAINGAQFHKLSTNTIRLTADGVTTGGTTTNKETNALNLDNTGGISFGIKGADGITTTANGTDVTVKLDATTKAKLDNLDADANNKYAKKDATNMTGLTDEEKAKWREAIGLEHAVTGTGKLQIDAATKDAAGTETANGKATVKLDGTQNFKLVGKDGITVTGSNDEDNQTLTFGLDKDTTDKLKNITAVSDGKDGKATNGTDGSNGSHGLTGKDGLNGKDLTTKVNALRNGEAGTVVYTDAEGNRLVKANDGKYYKANEVDEKGALIGTPTAVDNPELRVVNANGETTKPTALNNLASGLGLTNTTGAAPTAITANDAKTTVNNLLTKTDGLNKAVNVGDLQALAQAGLNFTGNSGNAHAPLSTTVNVAGQGTTAAGFVGASGNINVVASEDTTTANKIAKLEIQLAEALKGIKSIQNGDTKITLDKDNGVKVDGKDGGKVVVNGKDGKDGVTITGTDGTNGSSIVVNGKDGAAGKDSVTIKGGDGTNGSSIAVNGKDGKDGVTIKGTNGTDGSSIAVNGKDGKDGVTIKGTNGTDGSSIAVNGKDGKDGVTIKGTNGTDGSSIVVNGKDGAPGVTINGGNGTNGKDATITFTKDGANGTGSITGLKDPELNADGTAKDKTAATTVNYVTNQIEGAKTEITNKINNLIDGGMTYKGNSGDDVKVELKGTLNIKGEGNYTGTGSASGNIAVVGDLANKTLEIKLNKDLKNIETISNGDTKITLDKDNGVVKVDGTDGGKVIVNGKDGNSTVAINGGDGTNGSSIAVNGKDGKDGVTIKGTNGTDGSSIAVNGKDGKDGVTIKGTNGTDGSSIAVNGKDGKDGVTIKGTNGTDGSSIAVNGKDGKDGVTIKGTNGTDGSSIAVNGKDGKDGVTIKGTNGTDGSSIAVNGKDGKDGVTIKGTNGTDGSSIVVNGKDGAPGVTINGGNGTNGKDATITFTKDGTNGTGSITGLKDPELNPDGTAKDKTAATTVNYVTNQITNVTNKINDVANKMDKGLNFVGNSGGTVNAKLDGTVSIKGEGTIATGIGTAANNITVEKDTTAGSTGLVVKLADKLTGMTGFETKEENGKKVTIDKDGISLTTKATTGTPATNLKLGTDGTITGVVAKPDDKTSVATVGYVDSKIGSGITFGGDKGNNQAQELGTTLKVKAATETITANAKDYQGNEIKYKDQDGTDKNVTANYRGNNLITSYNYDTANKTGTISVAMSERPEFAAVTVGKGDTKATLDGEKGSLEFNKTIEKGKDGQPIVYANNDGKIVTYKDENGKIQPIYKQIGKGTISGLKDVDYLEVDGNRVAIDRTQAVNAGYVDDQLGDVRTRINNNTTRITELSTESRAGIAGVAAMANIPQINDAGSNKYNISVGIGKHRGETAYALGISGVSDGGRVVYKASAALDSQNKVTAGIGLGYQFGKRDIEASELDRFKAQMALLQTDSNKKFEKLEKEQQRMREEQEAIKATHNKMQEAIVAIDKKTDAIDKLNQMKMNQLEERINQKVEKIDSLNQLKINQINKEMEKVKNKLKIYK